jgi:hypothetical protein
MHETAHFTYKYLLGPRNTYDRGIANILHLEIVDTIFTYGGDTLWRDLAKSLRQSAG